MNERIDHTTCLHTQDSKGRAWCRKAAALRSKLVCSTCVFVRPFDEVAPRLTDADNHTWVITESGTPYLVPNTDIEYGY